MPARLSTAALWAGSLSLIGPLKLVGVLMVGSLVAPCMLVLERRLRQEMGKPISGSSPPLVLPAGLTRATQAAQQGLSESQLFRARHASVCTVHHDENGCIVHLEIPVPHLPMPVPSPDAHPVG